MNVQQFQSVSEIMPNNSLLMKNSIIVNYNDNILIINNLIIDITI